MSKDKEKRAFSIVTMVFQFLAMLFGSLKKEADADNDSDPTPSLPGVD